MRLGLNLGYGPDFVGDLALAQEADRLGYAVVWAAEAYGRDAPTVLSWIAAQTRRVDIGSAVMQIPARTPAMTAMTAATLDAVTGGRFRLGLGVSGPQVSEGWHGVRFDHPLDRTREYVGIVRSALRRERVTVAGEHFVLPLPDGPGTALRLNLHPVREHIPLYLAAVGPRNIELAGEVADGWLAIFFSAAYSAASRTALLRGRATAGESLAGFDVSASVPMVVEDDLAAAADRVRGYAALYLGGMGSRRQNFYRDLAVRMGFESAAGAIQDAYLARDYAGAEAAVPQQFLDDTSLLGPVERIAERMSALAEAGVTTLNVIPFAASAPARLASLRAAVTALELSGAAT